MENRQLERLSFAGFSYYLMDQDNFAVSPDYGCRIKDVSIDHMLFSILGLETDPISLLILLLCFFLLSSVVSSSIRVKFGRIVLLVLCID